MVTFFPTQPFETISKLVPPKAGGKFNKDFYLLMSLVLETWYTVDQISHNNGQLHIRLLPDHFSSEIVQPVMEISISEPSNTEIMMESLDRYKTEYVVDIKLTPTTLQLWGEDDDKPIVVVGKTVSLAKSAYSQDDLIRIVQSLEDQVHSCRTEFLKLRTKSNEVEGYIAELKHRAEAKRSLTTRSAATENATIEVLARILNRIRAN